MKTLLLVIALSLTTVAEARVPYYVRYAPVAYPQMMVPAPVYVAPRYAYRPVLSPVVPVVGRRVVAMPVAVVPVAAVPVVVAPVVVPIVTTRYRPFLGGTVSRVRYAPSAVVVPVY